MKHEILRFRATSGFGKWKMYFPEEAVAHPAKINLYLLEWLIQNYTEEGDTVADPMCGTGSTIVLSMLNNRNSVGVELGEKFTGWATQAVKKVEHEQTLTLKGKGIVICGDSRKLSELLKEHEEGNIKEFGVDVVLMSPPYDEGTGHGGGQAIKLLKEKKLYLHGAGSYSNSKSNIGELKKETYLEAMKIVYAECHKVLKPHGLLILILKNFIHNKKVVQLTDHTIKLCGAGGFKLKERLLFKLPTQSFWRRLYSKKFPEVDTADLRYEHILIFKKR